MRIKIWYGNVYMDHNETDVRIWTERFWLREEQSGWILLTMCLTFRLHRLRVLS
jgi:hypothetical protein